MCLFNLSKSNPTNDQFTVSMQPPLPVDCSFSVAINGTPVQPHSEVGGLKVVGLGAAGTATFEIKEAKEGTITMKLLCNKPLCGITEGSIEYGPFEFVDGMFREKRREHERREEGGIPLGPSGEEAFREAEKAREQEEKRKERREIQKEERKQHQEERRHEK